MSKENTPQLTNLSFKEIWESRNPQHEFNSDTYEDMFWESAEMCAREYASQFTQQKEVGWVSVVNPPTVGGEYNVIYDLEDGQEPLVSTMDYDAIANLWMDTRGANIPVKALFWQSLPKSLTFYYTTKSSAMERIESKEKEIIAGLKKKGLLPDAPNTTSHPTTLTDKDIEKMAEGAIQIYSMYFPDEFFENSLKAMVIKGFKLCEQALSFKGGYSREDMEKCFKAGEYFGRDEFMNPPKDEYINSLTKQ